MRKDVRPGQRIVKTESSTLLLRCGGTTGAMRPALEVGSMAAKCPTCGKREIRHPPGGKPSTGYRKHGCRCCACRAWKSGQNSARDRSKRPAEPARIYPATIAPERPRQVPQSAPQRPASPGSAGSEPTGREPATSPPDPAEPYPLGSAPRYLAGNPRNRSMRRMPGNRSLLCRE